MMKMFNSRVMLCFVLAAFTVSARAQWFTVSEAGDKVWLIDEHGSVNAYLVEGSKKALLIDTGNGVADLASVVKKLTKKPLIVVNTHGHTDHCGANYQFETVYIHPKDSAAAAKYRKPPEQGGAASKMTGGKSPAPEEMYKGKIHYTRMIPITEGYVFDLGGRHIEVIETPGHSAGEIVLLDKEHKYLFSGDNNNGIVWLFLPTSTPLSVYLKSLEKEVKRIKEFDTLFPGHGPKMPSSFINDQISCVKSILDGSCKGEPYQSFVGGKAMICKYGNAGVTYNPDNIR